MQLEEAKSRTKETTSRMKSQLEMTRAELMKDLQYQQEVNQKKIEAMALEKKKVLDEMN